MSWPHGDPNAVVARVLADPAYRSAARTTAQAPARSPLELAFAWLWEHAIRPLVHPIANALAASRGVGTTAGFVLVALALLGLGYLAFRLALAFGRERTSGARGGGSLRPLDRERSAVDWRGLARAAAARAEYGPAIAALFGAALAELDERAVVAFDAARTPGEYRRMVRRARAPAAVPFDALAERYNRALYAAGAPLPAEYEAAERALAALAPALSA